MSAAPHPASSTPAAPDVSLSLAQQVRAALDGLLMPGEPVLHDGVSWRQTIAALSAHGLLAAQLDEVLAGASIRVVRPADASQHVLVCGAALAATTTGWRQHLRELRQPLGVSLALLGPDGTGKSTIAAACCARLGHLFSRTSVQHLRPTVLPELKRLLNPRKWGTPRVTQVVTDPHAKPPAGTASSYLRLAYYCGDYALGYLPRVRGLAAQQELVFYDRYHADFLADPRRWRIRLPELPRRLASERLPAPDLMVLLDAPAEVLVARKLEVPLAEVARQRGVYRDLMKRLDNGHIVDGNQSPEAVTRDVCALILQHQQHSVSRRLRLSSARGESPLR